MGAPAYFKAIRLSGKPLDLANELIADFATRGLRASYTSVINAAIPLMHHAMIGKGYKLWSNAEIAEQRANATGNCVATVLTTLCRAQVSMAGCELAYYPEVDAIGIRLDAIGDTLINCGGADPAAVANVVTERLREKGYLQGDGGAQFVDMDQLLQRTAS